MVLVLVLLGRGGWVSGRIRVHRGVAHFYLYLVCLSRSETLSCESLEVWIGRFFRSGGYDAWRVSD